MEFAYSFTGTRRKKSGYDGNFYLHFYSEGFIIYEKVKQEGEDVIRAAILGASGYAGGELARLLLAHPQAQISHMIGVSSAGQQASDLFPYLRGLLDQTIEPLDMAAVAADSDVLFMAMPHGQGVAPALAALEAGLKVIDIGADFRFRDAAVYEQWYRVKHDAPEWTARAVYGLPEIYRQQIKTAQVVGNPGCYPTASLLSLYPLLKEGLVEPGSVVIDAKSGTSGAGKSPGADNIYCQVNENIKPYKVASHRHTPEIEQVMSDISGEEQVINFTPHLTPMTRGILATTYAKLRRPSSGEELTQLYAATYAGEPFVTVHPHGQWPQSKWAAGSNVCHVGITYDPRTGRVVAAAVIDNLVKGAAGQALQNMNLLFGLPETMGLPQTPLFP